MLQPRSWEQLASQAELKEKSYDWTGASESYRAALGLLSESDIPIRGKFSEELAYALFRASMQAGSSTEFTKRMNEGISACEKSIELYGKQGEKRKQLRCQALLAYMKFWTVPEPSEKKRLVEESWRLTVESMGVFETLESEQENWKTWSRLSPSAGFCWWYQRDYSVAERVIKDALMFSQQTIQNLATTVSLYDLARAYVIAVGWLDASSSIPLDPGEQENYRSKARAYWEKAAKLSGEAAHLEFLESGPAASFFGTGSDEALCVSRKLLEYARKSGDRYLIGFALEHLSFHNLWKSESMEDPEVRAHHIDESLRFAQEAKQEYSHILFKSSFSTVMWAEEPYPYYYFELSKVEPDPTQKRSFLEKALETAPRMLKAADDSGVPYNISSTRHLKSKILQTLALFQTIPDDKRRLLEEALRDRIETISVNERTWRHYFWDLGVFQNYLSNIKYELSKIQETAKSQVNTLREAVSAKESSLDYWSRVMPMIEQSPSSIEQLGERYLEYGDMLSSLSFLTNSTQHLKNAVNAYEQATKHFSRSGSPSREAEGYWRLAQTHDSLGDHVNAAKAFDQASERFRLAAEKIPRLKELYTSQASYMEAWSMIEAAKQHHKRQEYEIAGEFYEKAAVLHKSTRQWNFLAPNYSAWAEVETAESLSRKDQIEAAIEGFQKASDLFGESKDALTRQLGQVMGEDEKKMVSKLVGVANIREEYCLARILVEEAKSLDRKGDHYSSSEKYDQAVEAFEKIVAALGSDPSVGEFRLIVALSKAWQKMTRAEADALPELYLEASKLFEDAKQFSPTEKSKMLTIGHSRFCKALEAEARFNDTKDRNYYERAIQNLESAASFYAKAGIESASEYVKACKLLIDGYVYVNEANLEKDHEKKARVYAMAEKVLQASAESFQKSQYLGRQEEVLSLLKRVRDDREMARSLSDILHSPTITSTTASFSMPTPTFEKAVGIERFEHAAVQANLIVPSRELRVDEDFDMEIELVNAGRGIAQLVKIEQIVPEGFRIASHPEHYRLEDSFLNMKGKQLSPLKTEEVKLVVKAQARGRFSVNPRILYLDDTGNYKSYEPEPVEVAVKELGITGWVRGRKN